jgi:hypothetical protein
MKNFREMDPQKRHEIFVEHLNEMKTLDPAITTMEELLGYDDGVWEPILDEIVVILLEQIRFVLEDVGLKGSAMDWIGELIDFTISRESKIVFRRFEQTRGITKAFQGMEKTDPKRPKYLQELKKRGII